MIKKAYKPPKIEYFKYKNFGVTFQEMYAILNILSNGRIAKAVLKNKLKELKESEKKNV